MESRNPALSEKAFNRAREDWKGTTMTVNGTVDKAMMLTALLFLGAGITWYMFTTGVLAGMVMPLMLGGGIGGFIFALITIFKPSFAPVTAPIYAVLEGLLLGALSAFMESIFPGIALQAVMLTAGTLFLMLFMYKAGWIKVTAKFRSGVMMATGAVAMLYLASFIMGLFGATVPYIHEAGAIGIGFSVFVVGLAALNLLLDFDFIERAAAQSSPKFMEWYGAFSLILTIVWLYLEILRLLSKLRK